MVIKFIGKHSISILFILSVACSKVEKEPNAYSYKNSKLAIEDRVQNLLSQMTLEEKVAQTASAVGGSEMFFDSLGNFNTTMFNKKYPYGGYHFDRKFVFGSRTGNEDKGL